MDIELEIKELGPKKVEKTGKEETAFEVRLKGAKGGLDPELIYVAGVLANDFRERPAGFIDWLKGSFESHRANKTDRNAFVYIVPEKKPSWW